MNIMQLVYPQTSPTYNAKENYGSLNIQINFRKIIFVLSSSSQVISGNQELLRNSYMFYESILVVSFQLSQTSGLATFVPETLQVTSHHLIIGLCELTP